MKIEALREWMAARFEVASLEYLPFPHLIVERFFPDDVYEMILQRNPFRLAEGAEWKTTAEASTMQTETLFWLRKQFRLPIEPTLLDNRETGEFWRSIYDVFHGEDWFFRLVAARFETYLLLRFGSLVREPDFRSLFTIDHFLQVHDLGYSIGPHTDVPTRVLTAIFSFADQAGFDQYGTEFC